MGWKDLHWEKIPGQSDKDVFKKQLEEANKHDIPVRAVRLRRKDRKEVLYFEQLFKQRPGQSPATVSLSIYERLKRGSKTDNQC